MRAPRVLFVIAAAAIGSLAAAEGAAAQVPESCPRPGYIVAPGTGAQEDRNGNGIVCVDPTTGDLSDDVDPPDRDYDRNRNFFVCYDPEKGVITDDNERGGEEGQFYCPGSFQPWPAILFEDP